MGENGLHGHIIYSDGTRSPDFITVETALWLLYEAEEEGKATVEEVCIVEEQILKTLMPSTAFELAALENVVDQSLDDEWPENLPPESSSTVYH